MTPSKSFRCAAAMAVLALPPASAQVSCATERVTFGGSQSQSAQPSLDGGLLAFSSQLNPTGDNPDGNLEIFLWDGSSIRQLTSSTTASPFDGSTAPSVDGDSVAFVSHGDLTGGNPDGNAEIFLFDGDGIVQITDAILGSAGSPTLDGGSIAFHHGGDLTGGNPDGSIEIFLWDGAQLVQVTSAPGGSSAFPSLDGGRIAFQSSADLTGGNPDGSTEIFLWDGEGVTQLTSSSFFPSISPSLDGGSVAFLSSADLTGGNPDLSWELFVHDGAALRQITDAGEFDPGVLQTRVSASGGSVAFVANADYLGANPDQNLEIFLWDGEEISQVTDTTVGSNEAPSLDGTTVAFLSNREGSGGAYDIYLAQCTPPPPDGPWLASPRLPGFEAKVRIGGATPGGLETDCIRETLCVSGALPGRPELFIKVIGPRPNGFLWVQVSRFTPSRAELWIRQEASGTIRYYELGAVGPASDDVPGLQDREAFRP